MLSLNNFISSFSICVPFSSFSCLFQCLIPPEWCWIGVARVNLLAVFQIFKGGYSLAIKYESCSFVVASGCASSLIILLFLEFLSGVDVGLCQMHFLHLLRFKVHTNHQDIILNCRFWFIQCWIESESMHF